nr:T9SS type A sorting domain-containing protein [Bacteroidales bacterium]
PKEYRSGKLTITNTMGQVILSKSLNSNPEELIDPGKIASGAYTVTLSNEKESISSKLIIR